MKKYTLNFSKTLLMIVIAFFIILSLPTLFFGLGFASLPSPPKPEIKYSKYPFKLTYEINGKSHIIVDSVICTFDGVGMNTGVGKYNKWKFELASGNKEIVIKNVSENEMLYFKVPCHLDKIPPSDERSQLNGYYEVWILSTNGSLKSGSRLDALELNEKYKIKIIEWEQSGTIIKN